VAGPILAAALLSGACHAAQSPPEPTPATPAPATAHGSLSECLRAQGVPESAGPAAVLGPPSGVDDATWERAMQACATLAPGPAGP
jgi:hypothetical protein